MTHSSSECPSSECPAFEVLRRQLGWLDAGAKFFSQLFDHAPNALIAIDWYGQVKAANGAACRMHAVDRDELVRMRIQDLIPLGVDLGTPAKSLRDRGEASLEFTEVTSDGTATSTRVEARQFLPRQYVISFEDITKETKLRSELARRDDQQRFQGAAARVVHDVNNMLAPILCCTDALAIRQPLDNELRSIVSEIRSAAERAASLMRNLLSITPREPELISISEVVDRMTDMLRRLAGDRIELAFRFGESLPPVEVDREELERLVLNLALNARDAMPEGGRLTIETENVERGKDGARFATLVVTDTGHGMDARTKERIFEPFFTTKQAGTGLGLSNALSFVEKSHGYVEVDSEPRRGTTFRIGFPAARSRRRSA